MKTLFDEVGDFHKKFGLPHADDGGPPALLEEGVLSFRTDFMDEELEEFITATEAGDIVKATDALCDLVYVVLGTAHMMRLPFNECWKLVQEANMTKVRADGATDPRSKRGHELDVVKPEHFVSPEGGIAVLLDERMNR
jgi:predicted HAD superfamily Cof-like phosphohydrolase